MGRSGFPLPVGVGRRQAETASSSPAARIDELVLRVPGLSPDEARRLGRDVTERVFARLDAAPMHLGRLDLRLTLPLGLPLEELADRVANAIVDQLERGA